ncbi:MAG: PilN domain-containing protein [Myxococcota bacterium]|nr:PilN domain-containing protein [Myxococcota bacterium]
MIRVNLLPIREEARQRDLKQQLMLLGLVVIAEMLALSMWYASVADVLGTRQSELRIEQRKTTELQREAGTLDKLKKEEEKLRAKAEIVDIIDKLRADPSRVMMQLARNIPNRVWLTGMSFYPIAQPLGLRDPVVKGGERISIDMLPKLAEPIFAIGVTGYAMGPSDVTDFAKNMRGSALFDHIEFGEVKEVLYKEAQIPVQSFSLFARVAGWKPAEIDRSGKKRGKK